MDGPVEIELDPTPPPRRRRRFGAGRSDVGDEPAASSSADHTSSDRTSSDHTTTVHDGPPRQPPWRPASTGPERAGAERAGSERSGVEDPRAGRRVLVVAAAAVLLLTGFLLGRSGGGASSDAAATLDADVSTSVSAPPTTRSPADRSLVTLPSANPSRSSTSPTTERPPTTTSPPLRVVDMGVPLTPSRTDLVVVGLTTEGELAEIDLDRGVARFVDVPDMASSQAANSGYAYVGETSTVVGTWERQTLSVVPAGGEPFQMPTSLSRSAHVVTAGPGPDLFWVQPLNNSPDDPMTLAIADVTTGELVGEPFQIDGFHAGMWAPLAGPRSLISGVGGTYTFGEGGVQRISDGVVVGVGDAHVLAIECDAQMECSGVLIGDDGSRTVTRSPTRSVGWPWGLSSISPDGSMLALVDFGSPGPAIRLVDLASGEEQRIAAGHPTNYDGTSRLVAWSADSRTLVFLDGRRLSYHVLGGEDTVEIGVDLPSLVTFDTRRAVPGTGTMVPPPVRQ